VKFGLFYVSTDDPMVADHCSARPGTADQMRDPHLSDLDLHLQKIVRGGEDDMVGRLDFFPDIVAVALDTLLMHEVDQVVSIYEDHDLHFRHGRTGLELIKPAASRGLRLEREPLFTANNAVHAFWRDGMWQGVLYQGRVGHTVMTRLKSLQAKHSAAGEPACGDRRSQPVG
jgi:hypothetical protein